MSVFLEDLLDQTRDAVLAGDIASLARLAPQVEAVVNGLPQLDAKTAEGLREKAKRNVKLIKAASRGVRAAQARMVEITSGPTLTTYDALGRKKAIAPLSQLAARRF
ncbi:hypothetical protein [Tabrizicola sp.]|uniref:hypothetical protein n=1 Tax=Tabrizicola sp. TaxID=2005166 RepID=UPI002604C0D8|nr:hypothetical protein [Tabrizicola sp.]MDM7931836.1 hypothetical protein [Tabrizicola sp.]